MPNPVVHFEIQSSQADALKSFYGDLFGWRIDSSNPMNYGIVNTDSEGEGIGGGIGDAAGGVNRVTFYVQVDDPQAHLDKAESMGGKTIMPVTAVMPDVVIAHFSDPEGNVIGLLKAVEQ